MEFLNDEKLASAWFNVSFCQNLITNGKCKQGIFFWHTQCEIWDIFFYY